MTFQIQLQPNGTQFSCDSDETILTAAIRAGAGLSYSCKNGHCGACAATIVAGTVASTRPARALTPELAAGGACLLCCATARSDLVIAVRAAPAGGMPVRAMLGRVSALAKVAPDVTVLTLQLAASAALLYRAGQYVDFIMRDGTRRSYSVANAPRPDGVLTFHIRHRPGGQFTDQVFHDLRERHILRLEGPHGSFYLHEAASTPVILAASGTGFAPIKAIVERLIALDWTRPVTLYWGGRRPHDLYMDGLCRSWAQHWPHFRYVPVLSAAVAGDAPDARAGHVHSAVRADFPDLSGHHVYACGAPAMVEQARRTCVQQCGLQDAAFHADIFTPAT